MKNLLKHQARVYTYALCGGLLTVATGAWGACTEVTLDGEACTSVLNCYKTHIVPGPSTTYVTWQRLVTNQWNGHSGTSHNPFLFTQEMSVNVDIKYTDPNTVSFSGPISGATATFQRCTVTQDEACDDDSKKWIPVQGEPINLLIKKSGTVQVYNSKKPLSDPTSAPWSSPGINVTDANFNYSIINGIPKSQPYNEAGKNHLRVDRAPGDDNLSVYFTPQGGTCKTNN